MYDITIKTEYKEMRCKCGSLKLMIDEVRCHFEVVILSGFERIFDDECVYKITLLAI